MKNNKGFSLVELIVVIAIMAILAAVAIPTFATFITRANEASDKQFVSDLEYAIDLANTTFGQETELTKITAAGGDISKVEYSVGDKKVTINVTSAGVATVDATEGATTVTGDALKAVEDVISAMDWTYNFKSAAYATGYPLPANGNN